MADSIYLDHAPYPSSYRTTAGGHYTPLPPQPHSRHHQHALQQHPPPLQHRPPSPVKQTRKGAGVPKAKGAVRAKSGCYTCRIRRKKCDEQADGSGSCQTCVRLRLECLGFGAKRPDWMREGNSVPVLRERIKQFLASQGMIKGHSGAAPRSTDKEPPLLTLSVEPTSTPTMGTRTVSSRDSTASPPSAASAELHGGFPHIVTSAVRDAPRTENLVPYSPISAEDGLYASNGPYSHIPALTPQSSIHTHGLLHEDNSATLLSNYGPPHVDTSAVGSIPASRISPTSPYTPLTASSSTNSYIDPQSALIPLQTSFSPLYNQSFDEYDEVVDLPLSMIPPGPGEAPMTVYRSPSAFDIFDVAEVNHIGHYLQEVLDRQYLLADRSIANFIFQFAHTSHSAKSAMCLLSALHMNCMKKLSPTSDIHETSTEDMNLFYGRTKKALTEKVQFEQYDEGDAMASLHVVSSFLFTGGRGPWPFFLTIAMNWVEAKLRDPRYTHLEDILYRASESESFIIRTTMWFDVWASITQIRQPRFLNVYRQLFGNPRSYVVEADQGMNSPDILGGPSYLSMVPIVGCTNESFRAMAEIANLASWKETENEQSRLSIPTLVQRGLQIEEMYLPRLRPTVQEPTNEMEFRRKVVSDVFRASARVYLHTVLSKGYPSCPEIEDGVAETIECLKLVPPQEGMTTRAVVRSVVFSICICGCLTDRPDQQQFLLQRLESLGEEANVFGNCAEVKKLMQKVWAMREERKGMALCWKEIMQEGGSDILLLV